MKKLQPMTKPRKVLRTTSDVVAAFGGTAKCARRWDCSPAAVSQWKTAGVPVGYHFRMAKALERDGYIVDGDRLGWTEWPA